MSVSQIKLIQINCKLNDNEVDGKDKDSQNISNVNIRDNEQVHKLKEEPSFTNGGQSQRKASPKSRIEIPDVSPVSKRVIDQGKTIKIQGTEVIEEHNESDFISVGEELHESLDQNCNECIEEDTDSTEYDSQDELEPSDYLEPNNSESDEDY